MRMLYFRRPGHPAMDMGGGMEMALSGIRTAGKLKVMKEVREDG